MGTAWRTWGEAMAEGLYGAGGFYRRSGSPGRNFRTAAHVGGPWVGAIRELAGRVDRALGFPAAFTVADVGAGGGELVRMLAAHAPARWSLIGVDVAPRPDDLPDRVEWIDTLPDPVIGLLVAVELLDVVPVDVVAMTDDGPRIVEVTSDRAERLGGRPSQADLEWLDRFWPGARPGDRLEIGRQRDALWRDLIATLDAGVAVAIDYAVCRDGHRGGTLTGFRSGRQVTPVPDGSCDLTAHVQFDSLLRDGDLLLSQREALLACGVAADLPGYNDDPAGYLSSLVTAGEAAELLNRDGLGGFTWLLHGVNVEPDSVLPRNTRAAHTSART